MPRPWRIEFPGARYHVINRGNYRQRLFAGKGAAEAFERTLAEAAVRFGWVIHAYVIMNNHFHLAVEITEPNLSLGMKWLQGTWIRRFNGFRGLIGRPFQGRYKALIVESGELGKVCHYIHLNPVRAKLLPPHRVAEYRWSSLPRFLGRNRPFWLNPDVALESAGDLADTPRGWQGYLAHLEFLGTDEQAKKELGSGRLSRGWCLGSTEFRREMRQLMEGKRKPRAGERFVGLEGVDLATEREAAWEEQLREFARAAKVDPAKLGPRKSDPAKVLLAAAMKLRTSASNGWLAARLGMGQPASASQFVRRLLLTKDGAIRTQQLLSRVKT